MTRSTMHHRQPDLRSHVANRRDFYNQRRKHESLNYHLMRWERQMNLEFGMLPHLKTRRLLRTSGLSCHNFPSIGVPHDRHPRGSSI